ncbi:anthranilate phosphoribosyltransferase [Paenibacillus ihbetae]|uniref:Anthranilate phosphoribosyltransferase n=1 Tax=Paenibacillus ihbetae TaxID=1870820 RepID=A0ABX3K3F4_9BACL|nr:anthranilate phosphoribosyltransferase [Paenibacillus ihbetae]OOC63953.1 anthranilate phosphoribosyltransferase [Paenibacillus ihbetae]
MTMIKLLKEVGRGKRGSRDLNYNEAVSAAEWILEDKATPAQIGAFFMAERMKMESVEELEAFIKTLRDRSFRKAVHAGLDCAGPYDGRKTSFYASFPTAFLLAAAGLPVTLHGSASLPPKWGVTVNDLLLCKGVDPASISREQSILAAELTGVLFVDAEQWCPPLRSIRPIREEIGMRTILNTAEKLIDFSHSPYLVYGVFHNTVFDRMAQLLQNLRYRKALIVQGAEGSEDLHIHRATRVQLVHQGHSELHLIDPELFGLEAQLPEIEWTAEEQLRVTEEVLQGKGHIAFTNQVLLNAAVRLHLCERAASVEEGLYTLKSLLDNRLAWYVYDRWLRALLEHPAQGSVSSIR